MAKAYKCDKCEKLMAYSPCRHVCIGHQVVRITDSQIEDVDLCEECQLAILEEAVGIYKAQRTAKILSG